MQSMLISVTGLAGIGKSTVVNKVAHYLKDRDYFDYVVYTDIRDLTKIDDVKTQIVN